jgi:hypothetical protein
MNKTPLLAKKMSVFLHEALETVGGVLTLARFDKELFDEVAAQNKTYPSSTR